VTSLLTERFGAPATTRDGRVHAFERERAIDTLAGRTVWCASALPTGRSRAQDLHRCLEWTGDGGVAADPLDVPAGDPLVIAAGRIEAMLDDVAGAGPPGAAERTLYAEGIEDAQPAIVTMVRPGDVVVLHDPLAAAFALSVREGGAHAIWRIQISRPARGPVAEEAWRFLEAFTAPVDAYVVTWTVGPAVHEIAAAIPAASVVCAKEATGAGGDDLAWGSVLADVVDAAHVDRLGGTLNVRPAVAAR
jgi:hypothetical protein